MAKTGKSENAPTNGYYVTGMSILEEARGCWQSLSEFRRERKRNKDYTFGKQWGDMITINGRKMTEYDYIISEGHMPLKNNLIRRIVRNVLGVFRRQLGEKMSEWDETLREDSSRNGLYELYSRIMEEFLISGIAVCRKWKGVQKGEHGCWTDTVAPDNLFFDSTSHDSRGWDMGMVGQFHELSFSDYCKVFISRKRDYEFLLSRHSANAKIRVAEIWRHEQRPRRLVHDTLHGRVIIMDESLWDADASIKSFPSKWFLDDVWHYYFLDMEGNILKEGDSPYLNGGHPYVVKCYPFLDGEIHSFVADILDQQKYTNRLITMYDWIMRASAKGVLLIPEGAVEPENMQDVVDQWSKFNGVIVYKTKAGQPDPRQVSGNATNIGISELLDIQLKMLEDVSGVNGALQGNVANNSVSGTLYNQQTQNALTSLSDILDTFAAFISDCNALKL